MAAGVHYRTASTVSYTIPMTKKTPSQVKQLSHSSATPLYRSSRPVQQQKIPTFGIILAVTAVFALYGFISIWDFGAEETTSNAQMSVYTDVIWWAVGIIAALFILPGIIAALIVWAKLRKK